MGRGVTILLSAVLLVTALGACADDASQRQFANDPQATEDVVGQPPQPAATRIVTPTAFSASPVTSAQLIDATGAASTIFLQNGPEVIAVTLNDGKSKIIYREKSGTIVALAVAPDSTAAAVMSRNTENKQIIVRIISREGENLLEKSLPVGDEEESSKHGRDALAWSPAGDRLLLSQQEGGIVEIQRDEVMRTILAAAQAPSPRALAWSPTGNAIAYADAGNDGSATGLYAGSIESLPLDPVTIIRPIEGRSRQIQDIAWVGGNVGIVYSERAPDGDLSIGGDLFAVQTSGGLPRLLATAGGVSQVGAVGDFTVSPNLLAVAYSVLIPGADGSVAGKLIVRQVDGAASVQLPISVNGSVIALAWSTQGLVWAETRDGGIVVNGSSPNGYAVEIASFGVSGSPIASPKAEASPVTRASPIPISSPIASPIGE